LKVSGVIPVHNEEKYLPYSLAALKHAKLDELVFILDRCTDRSREIIESTRLPYKTTILTVEKRRWCYPTAEVFKLGFEKAHGDIIYSLAADVLYDPGIFTVDWSSLDVASFLYYDYSLYGGFIDKLQASWINVYRKAFNLIYPHLKRKTRTSGIYAFRRSVLMKVPIRDVPSEDITFVKEAISQGFRYRFFPDFHNLHLRPATRSLRAKQGMHGFGKAKLNYPLWKVVGHSVLLWKPETLRAYLKERVKP